MIENDLNSVKIQQQIIGRMSFEEKWSQSLQLRELAWQLKRAAVKQAHPDWNENQIEDEVRRIFLYATT